MRFWAPFGGLRGNVQNRKQVEMKMIETRDVLRRLWKTVSVGCEVTSGGRLFQRQCVRLSRILLRFQTHIKTNALSFNFIMLSGKAISKITNPVWWTVRWRVEKRTTGNATIMGDVRVTWVMMIGNQLPTVRPAAAIMHAALKHTHTHQHCH